MCHSIVFRTFADVDGNAVDPGYHNASLGTSGVAIPFPPGASGALVQVGAGCFIGVRTTATLATFDDDHYGSVLSGNPIEIGRSVRHVSGSTGYIHIAPWSSTTSVAVAFF